MSSRAPQGGKQQTNKGDKGDKGDKPPPKNAQPSDSGNKPPPKDNNQEASKNDAQKPTKNKDGKQGDTAPPKPDTGTGSSVVPPSLTGIQPLTRRTSTGLSNVSGVLSKSPTTTAMTGGEVTLFKAVAGEDGKVSAEKVLNIILMKMTVADAASQLKPQSKSESRPAPKPGKGKLRDPIGEVNIPVEIDWNNKPVPEPENWIRWMVPQDRSDENEVVRWSDFQEGYTYEQAYSDAGNRHRDTWLDGLTQKKDGKPPLCIIIRFTAAMMEIGDPISWNVSGILANAVNLTRRFDVRIDLQFSVINEPLMAEEEYKNMALNLVRVMVMLERELQSDDWKEVVNSGYLVNEGDPTRPEMSGARDNASFITARSQESDPFVGAGVRRRPARQDSSDDSGQNRGRRRRDKQPQREDSLGSDSMISDRDTLKMDWETPLDHSPPRRKVFGDDYPSGPSWKGFGGGR